MRVGILTFHFSDNYGALLQAYALRRWFHERGCEAEFINYHPQHVEDGGRLHFSFSPASFRVNAKKLFLRGSAQFQRRFGDKEREQKFASFRGQFVTSTGAAVRRVEDLASVCRGYDLLVAGSDQIWSPSMQYGFDPAYFLRFPVDGGARRISYAASFGTDTVSDEHAQHLRQLLSSLDGISVREESGVGIVRAATGRDAECVPDPTLLHAGYDALLRASTDSRRGHIFCYALRTSNGIREVAEAAAQALSAPIISPHNMHRRWREIGETVHPGPAEWISQIANASFVVTNSFHGTVFAILLRKPFLVAELPGSRVSMNARSRNLLSKLGLMGRYVTPSDTSRLRELIESPIDWEKVSAMQEAMRERGVRFLERELSRVVGH